MNIKTFYCKYLHMTFHEFQYLYRCWLHQMKELDILRNQDAHKCMGSFHFTMTKLVALMIIGEKKKKKKNFLYIDNCSSQVDIFRMTKESKKNLAIYCQINQINTRKVYFYLKKIKNKKIFSCEFVIDKIMMWLLFCLFF